GDLLDDDRQNGGGGDGEDGADKSPQRAADEQRYHHRDRTDTDAPFHDLRYQDVRLELVQDEKEDADGQRELRRNGQRDSDRGDSTDHGAENGNRLADRGNERHDIEIRHTHQAEPDG